MYEMNSFEPFYNIQSYFGNRFSKFSSLHRFEAISIILLLVCRLTFYYQVVLNFSLLPLGMYIESVKQQHEKASSPIFVTESEI